MLVSDLSIEELTYASAHIPASMRKKETIRGICLDDNGASRYAVIDLPTGRKATVREHEGKIVSLEGFDPDVTSDQIKLRSIREKLI